MNEPIFLNAGPSRRGWHRLESALRCPLLYAWKRSGHLGGEREPLVRGSIGHAGLAHLYARLKAVQEGRDPRMYASPVDAMIRCAEEFPQLGTEQLRIVSPLVKAYAEAHSAERLRVHDMEREHETMIGGYLYTARIDLEVIDSAGMIWWYDHKIVSKIETKTFTRYSTSGQFLGHQYLGRQAYGDRFAGVRLNLIGIGERFVRSDIEPAPWLLARFPEIVKRAEEEIARIDHDLDRGIFPGAVPTEVTCMTPYGACDAIEFCRWGSSD